MKSVSCSCEIQVKIQEGSFNKILDKPSEDAYEILKNEFKKIYEVGQGGETPGIEYTTLDTNRIESQFLDEEKLLKFMDLPINDFERIRKVTPYGDKRFKKGKK